MSGIRPPRRATSSPPPDPSEGSSAVQLARSGGDKNDAANRAVANDKASRRGRGLLNRLTGRGRSPYGVSEAVQFLAGKGKNAQGHRLDKVMNWPMRDILSTAGLTPSIFPSSKPSQRTRGALMLDQELARLIRLTPPAQTNMANMAARILSHYQANPQLLEIDGHAPIVTRIIISLRECVGPEAAREFLQEISACDPSDRKTRTFWNEAATSEPDFAWADDEKMQTLAQASTLRPQYMSAKNSKANDEPAIAQAESDEEELDLVPENDADTPRSRSGT